MLCHNRKKAASSAITVPVNFLRDLAEIYGISEGQSGSAPKAWLGTQGKERYAKGTQVRKSGTQKSKVRTKTDPKVSAEELISESGLSPQQSLFVAEYLIDQNATAAAERAGYSDPNYGRQLLTNLTLNGPSIANWLRLYRAPWQTLMKCSKNVAAGHVRRERDFAVPPRRLPALLGIRTPLPVAGFNRA